MHIVIWHIIKYLVIKSIKKLSFLNTVIIILALCLVIALPQTLKINYNSSTTTITVNKLQNNLSVKISQE